jgi:hypothetical protein
MMKLGFVSAILADQTFEEVISFASGTGYSCVERRGNIVCVWYGILLRRDYVLACRKGRKTLCRSNAH